MGTWGPGLGTALRQHGEQVMQLAWVRRRTLIQEFPKGGEEAPGLFPQEARSQLSRYPSPGLPRKYQHIGETELKTDRAG